MVKLLASFIFFLTCATSAFGVQGLNIKASTNNIATTYSASAPYILSGLKPQAKHIYVYNSTAGTIALTIMGGNSINPPAAGNPIEMLVGTNGTASGGTTFEFIGLGSQVYVRSNNGAALTTGEVIINVW